MALSFEDSKKSLGQEVANPMTLSLERNAESNEVWTRHTKYRWFKDFYDDKVSTVDDVKSIAVHPSQVNISQEVNSQFIPFEMCRRYDNIDLVDMLITFHYTTSDGYHGSSEAVNVEYTDERMKFAWLVDDKVTHAPGNLKLEIHADGAIYDDEGNSYGYRWKTKTTERFNVYKSLCDGADGESIELNDDWVVELVQTFSEMVSEKIADAQLDTYVTAAEDAVTRAEEAAQDASNAVQQELGNYYTKEEVDNAILGVDHTMYATKTYVADEIAKVDVTDQLPKKLSDLTDDANHRLVTDEEKTAWNAKSDFSGKYSDLEGAPKAVSALENDAGYITEAALNGYATEKFVEEAVKAVDVSEQLAEYAKAENVYTKEEVDEAVSNVEVDLSEYYTKQEVDTKTAPIATNASNITALGNTVGELQTKVDGIDTSPRKTYDVAYNDTDDPDVGENVFVFYEIENEGLENEAKEAKKKFTIVGGSGGGSGSVLKIEYITTSPVVATVDDRIVIKYRFSGTDTSGDIVTDGTATWKVAGRTIASNIAVAGENSFDITDYISLGTQKVSLSITDEAGSLATKSWTVQKIDIRLESSFNDSFTYPLGEVEFDYTPYGAISKDIHFILDGEEVGKVTTTASGIPMGYTLPAQEHGAHLLEVYITATVNQNTVESNHILKDIIWFDSASTVPVISTVYQNFTARQYDATNIVYTVHDPTTESPTVEIAVDGTVVSTPTLTETTNIYTYKTDVVGEHTITIKCGETVKTLKANITKLDIDISPVTAGLAFDFNPSGRSNNDADREWSDGNVSMTVSDNFDWINGGYQYDENGDQYFCIKAGTSAEVDYKLFADDAKKNGKEMKLVFRTVNVANPDAVFLSCVDNTTGSDNIGIEMGVHNAYIYGSAGKLDLSYSEEDIIEFEFNISKDTEAIPMVMGYEDGVSTRPMVYDDSHNFTQNTPKTISLGSEDCDLHIYRMKVYGTSLTDRGILNNFIADARNASEMVARHDRNQIYDENQNLDPDVLAEKCPWLRVYKVSAPYFTNNKSDKVPGTTIQQIYKDGDPILDNWTAYNSMHSGQGTSSNNYGAAGRNLDFIMNKSGIEGVDPYFIMGDGSRAEKITMTRTSVPVAYLNAKVNIASSNNMTNAMLANRYNEFNPYKRPFIREEGVDTSFIKDTMEFHNGVIFIQETNEDVSTHREFADTNWHFYGICNIGDSKKTDETRKTDIDDKYECCVEIMDVELPLSDFPVNTMYNAMGYTVDEKTEEKIYTWAKDENLGILYELIDGEYVLTEDTSVDLNKTYYVDILEHDDFSEDFTYGWRYLWEDGTDEENEEVFDYCKQKWIELYRFITTSTDEEFKAHLGDYFVIDSALYYYLFTTRYCLADNRSKNSFWHYGKTGEIGSDGTPIRKWNLAWGYDMDF